MPPDQSHPAPLAARLTRRSFLGQCSSAAGKVASGVVAAPLVIQTELEAALVKKKLRIGLLGVGNQGLRWAETILTSAETELVSWFDPDASQIDKAAGLLRKKGLHLPSLYLSQHCWKMPRLIPLWSPRPATCILRRSCVPLSAASTC